jgi:N-acetylmuramoyl-L-alanine amidase
MNDLNHNSKSSKDLRGRSESGVKSIAKKKIAQATAFMLLISILLPVIAFGATVGIKSGSYSYDKTTGTVTATVYSDVYDSVYGAVYLNVIAPDGSTVLGNVYVPANYTVTGGTYYFNVTGTLSAASVYDAVYLQGEYNGTVSANVYAVDVPPCTSNCGGGGGGGSYGGGGGGGGAPSTNDGNSIDVPSSGEVNSDSLKNALAANPNVTLNLTGDTALIPASALLDAMGTAGAAITIVSDHGSYILPLSALNLNALALSLGIDVKDLMIRVTIAKVSDSTESAVAAAAQAIGGIQIADAIDFKVEAVGTNGKTVPVDFGNTYISRTLNVSKAVDSKKTTGVLFNETTRKLSFVPATFGTSNGKNVATLKRTGNSIYTVLELNKNFNDIASHWSLVDVQLLANKLVVDGVTDTIFEPDRNITRAEFAALVVRSLGLDANAAYSARFNDVASSDWYAGVVAAAAQAKLIDGYEDGSFHPNAQINREELAAMVVRAMRYAGLNTTVSASQQATLLNRFMDADQIVWAKAEIAAAIDAGLINGMTDTTIGSRQLATRAQSAAMLKRFLTRAAFIN